MFRIGGVWLLVLFSCCGFLIDLFVGACVVCLWVWFYVVCFGCVVWLWVWVGVTGLCFVVVLVCVVL